MGKKKDRWRELCELVAADDKLPVRIVNSWSEDKVYWWHRYIDITTAAMHRKWHGNLCYVDLFAGPGVCMLKESKRRIPGSVLIAALAAKPFKKIIACELDQNSANACEQRLFKFGQNATVLRGDSNLTINQVTEEIPSRALTLSFIDPEGLHVHFRTIATLARNRKVDLLILFADRMDLVRNVDLYAKQPDSNLDKFLGPNCNWRDAWSQLSNQHASNTCKLFTELYQAQLATLGYLCDSIPVTSPYGNLYRLIYASKDELGLNFWKKAIKKKLSGQQDLF